ncbi:hypothetical protein PMAYCL1PPCAC_20219, partial [Pristionchus mayeri]
KNNRNKLIQRIMEVTAPPLDDSAPATDNSIIGTRVSWGCTKKGAPTDPAGRVSFCSACWAMRILPDNYSPKYVNEAVCDEDTVCLSGYATCSISTRAIDVVRNDSGVLRKEKLAVSWYCECKSNANSALQSLVTGSGHTTSLPSSGNNKMK